MIVAAFVAWGIGLVLSDRMLAHVLDHPEKELDGFVRSMFADRRGELYVHHATAANLIGTLIE